jgi:hypothetical protein
MTDYLAAKMTWEPEQSEDYFLEHYAAPFGSCSTRLRSDLRQIIDLESKYLFDQRLVGYLAGENIQTELGAVAGFSTHPLPVPFEKLMDMSASDRAMFEETVIKGLESMAREVSVVETDVNAVCSASSTSLRPWCEEVSDGLAIVRLRAMHTAYLYRAVLSKEKPQAKSAVELLALARATTEQAGQVIARREKAYRFDPERLTGAYENPTIYKFGYLRQAHTQCYWKRREQQAAQLVSHREPLSVLDLLSCVD